MEPILSGLSNYLDAQMSIRGKLATLERFILPYCVYFFIMQSLHLLCVFLYNSVFAPTIFWLFFFFNIRSGSKSFETKKKK